MKLPIFKDLESRMNKTISVYKEDLQAIRAGRANPQLLIGLQLNTMAK